MADDDNNTAAEMPPAEEEEENCVRGGGDIEQGRSSSSWVAAAISGRTSTAYSSTARRFENGDEEEAVPVHSMSHNVDMVGNKKGNTIANINTNLAAPSEDASTPPHGEMEQIEDGDDAAPRPFDYAEFDEDDNSKPKLDLGEESTDEDGGPPLPFTFGQQRDPLRDAKRMAATSQISSLAAFPVDGNESFGGDPIVGQIDELHSHGSEDNNILQRRPVVEPENHSDGGNEGARQVASLSAAAERNPSVPIPVAYLVEEEEEDPLTAVATPTPTVPLFTPGGHHDTIYEATLLEPDLPWWKQRRTKVFMVIICLLLAALALSVGLGVSSSSSSASIPPTISPSKPSYRCFADRNELKTVVDRYVKDGCDAVATLCKDLSDTYGWPMGSWCVIDVTDMSSLFQGLDTFNEDISMWNVNRVSDMTSMFAEAGTFNRDISSWNISSVTNMSYMFKGATSFNQNLCAWQDNFPYSNADDIFVDSGCAYKYTPSSETKGPLCSSSCNIPTAASDCFTTRDELKAAIDEYVQGYWGTADSLRYGWPIGSWCVDKVTDMSDLFKDLSTFNEDISGWEVGQVTNMKSMFAWAPSFNGDVSTWDTSAVTDMSFMFLGAERFNQDVSSWDTSAVTTMMSMFWGALVFNQDVSNWNTSVVTDMEAMFYNTTKFNQDVSNWNTSAVTTMRSLFNRALAFDGDISSWDTSAVTSMRLMFYGASEFNPKDLSKWDTSKVTDMGWMFSYASAFDGNISSWDTSAVTDMSYMFYGASSFKQGDLSNWNISAVKTMESMFSTNREELEKCADSTQCKNECCSRKNSEGVLKCTPVGGFMTSEGCVAVGSSTITTTSKLGNGEKCFDSKQCQNQCCSRKASKGILKCTPLNPVEFNPSEGCVGSAT